jgi:hypothetical protein
VGEWVGRGALQWACDARSDEPAHPRKEESEVTLLVPHGPALVKYRSAMLANSHAVCILWQAWVYSIAGGR